MKNSSEPANYFQIQQSRGKTVGQCVGSIGEIFYQLKGNSVFPVYKVKDFEACPNIFEFAKRAVASTQRFVTQQ